MTSKKVLSIKNYEDLIFEKERKTNTGSIIIDINNNYFQTCWCKILFDYDGSSICVDVPDDLKHFLSNIDNKVQEYFNNIIEEYTYKPLLKPMENGYYFKIPICSTSILFDNKGDTYRKNDFYDHLNIDDDIRFIIGFKKLYYKNYMLSLQIELIQSEIN